MSKGVSSCSSTSYLFLAIIYHPLVGLKVVNFSVIAVLCDKLLMCSDIFNGTVVEYDYLISILSRRYSLGYYYLCAFKVKIFRLF